jgi:anaerobic selenocysteine-containing dehydrogenase
MKELTRREFLVASGATVGALSFWEMGHYALAASPTGAVTDASPQSAVLAKERIVYTADAFCASECGLKVTTYNGVISTISAMSMCPIMPGRPAPKGSAANKWSIARIDSSIL